MWRDELEASETGSRERNQKAVAKAQARQWKLLNHDKECRVKKGMKVRAICYRAL